MGVRDKMVIKANGFRRAGIVYFTAVKDQAIKHYEQLGYEVKLVETGFERLVAPPFEEAGSFWFKTWEIWVKENSNVQR